MRTLRLAVAVALLATPALVSAQNASQKVNVIVFEVSGFALGEDSKAIAAAIRDAIVSELAKGPQINLIERAQIEALLRQQQIAATTQIPQDQAIRIAELAGAHYAVTGGFTFDAREARLDVRLLNIETSEIATTYKKSAPRNNYLRALDGIAADFLPHLKLYARAEDVKVPALATLAYSRGLDYERRGNKAKAAEQFQKALELFPNHAQARAALARVK